MLTIDKMFEKNKALRKATSMHWSALRSRIQKYDGPEGTSINLGSQLANADTVKLLDELWSNQNNDDSSMMQISSDLRH